MFQLFFEVLYLGSIVDHLSFGGEEAPNGGKEKDDENEAYHRSSRKHADELTNDEVATDKVHTEADRGDKKSASKDSRHRLRCRKHGAFLARFAILSVVFKGVGEQNGVVHRTAQFDGAYYDVDDEVDALSGKVRKGEVEPDTQFYHGDDEKALKGVP